MNKLLSSLLVLMTCSLSPLSALKLNYKVENEVPGQVVKTALSLTHRQKGSLEPDEQESVNWETPYQLGVQEHPHLLPDERSSLFIRVQAEVFHEDNRVDQEDHTIRLLDELSLKTYYASEDRVDVSPLKGIDIYLNYSQQVFWYLLEYANGRYCSIEEVQAHNKETYTTVPQKYTLASK